MNRQSRRDPYKFINLDKDQIEELAGKGELFISCGVANVKVEMNGEVVGKTDQAGMLHLEWVNVGFYMLLLSHPSYLPTESLVNVKELRQEVAKLTLTPRARRRFINYLKSLFRELQNGKRQAPVVPDAGRILEEQKVAENGRVAASREPLEFGGQVCGKCESRLPVGLKFCTECGGAVVIPDDQVQPPDAYQTDKLDGEMLSVPLISSSVPAQPEIEVGLPPEHVLMEPEPEVSLLPDYEPRGRKTIYFAEETETEFEAPPDHETMVRNTIDSA